MKRVLIVGLVLLALAGVGAYLLPGPLFLLRLWWGAPSHEFDLARKAAPPDYSSAEAWLALPETRDLADYVPAGAEFAAFPDVAAAPDRGIKPVDVFFVHPTTYLGNEDWNDPLRSGTRTEGNTRWVLANQASAYNDCCNVHAPRYRQASIYGFFAAEAGEQSIDLAYQDVERAFGQFLDRIGDERPFLLAGHSQGTIHLRRLLREQISGTPRRERMVAAYLIGGGVTLEELEALPDVQACESAEDLHCVVHWATYGPEGRSYDPNPTLCTNPLLWTTDETPAPASLNLGAVVPSGRFDTESPEDEPSPVTFEPLGSPLPEHTGARCQDGLLFVDAQEESPFGAYTNLPGRNYHGLDYALFYMNIRANTVDRVRAYVSKMPGGGIEAARLQDGSAP